MASIATVSMTFSGKQIEFGRRQKGMSQKRLARAMGVSENTIIGWEKGKFAPSSRDMAKLASMLDLKDTNPSIKTVLPFVPKEIAKDDLNEKTKKEHKTVGDVVKTPEGKTFAEQFRFVKENMKLSWNDICILTDMPRGTLCGYIYNGKIPNEETAKKIEQSLGIKFHDITWNKRGNFTNHAKPKVKEVVKAPVPTKENIVAKEPVPVVISPKTEEKHEVIRVSTIDKNFIANVKDKVKTHDIEAKMCKTIGIAPGFFFREDIDRDPITLETAVKVQHYLGISWMELLKDNEKAKIQAQIDMYEKKIKELRDKLGKEA